MQTIRLALFKGLAKYKGFAVYDSRPSKLKKQKTKVSMRKYEF